MAADRLEEEELFALAHEGFESGEVHQRSEKDRTYRYLKTDTVQNRLDDVFGPAGWSEHYQVLDDVTVVCTLTVTLPDGRVVTRQAPGKRKPATPHLKADDPKALKPSDVGGFWQTAFTSALKVTARKLGIGLYLKGPVPRFVQPALDRIAARDQVAAPIAEASPPATERVTPAEPVSRPDHLANGHGSKPVVEPTRFRNQVNQPAYSGPPRTGRQLFAWVRDQEQRHEVQLLRHLNSWAKLQGFRGRMVDWNDEQAEMGLDEAERKLQAIGSQEGPEEYEDALSN